MNKIRGRVIALFLCIGLLTANCGGFWLTSNKGNGASAGTTLLAAFAAATGTPVTADTPETSQFISAATGGTVYLGRELALSIPPGSLESDTIITVSRIDGGPDGFADGYSRFGQAYRFGPAGTTFAPDRPAILNLKYDGTAAQAMGLDLDRMQVYYFDEGMGRYINVANTQDRFSGTLTARIEHFTVYLPVAMASMATNANSVVLAQNPVPNQIRAGAPVYFRYTIHDKDPANGGSGYTGGAVASAELCVTKIVSAMQICVPLSPEKILDPTYSGAPTEDTWGALLDTTFWNAIPALDIDGTPAADLAFEVRVTDNLNNTVIVNPPPLDVPRIYDAGTAQIVVNTPSTQPVTSDFSRTVRVRARDTLGTFFNMLPNPGDVSVTNQIGTVQVQQSTGTILFTGEKRDVGNVTAFFGPRNATTSITVTNGPIDRIEILDTNGVAFAGAGREWSDYVCVRCAGLRCLRKLHTGASYLVGGSAGRCHRRGIRHTNRFEQ